MASPLPKSQVGDLEGGYVDTEIIRAKANDYIMILADIGCTSSRRQQLFM
jgi:hypothetical protein